MASEQTVETDVNLDPCHGDPRAGWTGAFGVWEPCPVCDPVRPVQPFGGRVEGRHALREHEGVFDDHGTWWCNVDCPAPDAECGQLNVETS